MAARWEKNHEGKFRNKNGASEQALQGKPMKSEQGRAMQKRLKVVLKKTSI